MKKQKTYTRVINFSGGRTSAYMTLMLKPTENDIVLFTDTGREHEATYRFIDDFEKNEGIKVHRTMYPGGYHQYVIDQKFLPNRKLRTCTQDLKILTAKRYVRKHFKLIAFENYIGFRFDEPKRVKEYSYKYKRVITKFPLYDEKITKPMVLHFWKNKPYDLQIPAILGNCTLCFLKGKDAIIRILQQFPELATPWIEDEKEVGSTFFKDISYSKLLQYAKQIQTLPFPLEDLQPAFTCSCTP